MIKPLKSVHKKPRGTCWTPVVPVPVTAPSKAPEFEVCKGEGRETCTEVIDANQRRKCQLNINDSGSGSGSGSSYLGPNKRNDAPH